MGGNLAAGLFANTWMVRLAPTDLEALLALGGAAPFSPMPGRTMTGHATLPADLVADDTALVAWVERALGFAASLPPKQPANRTLGAALDIAYAPATPHRRAKQGTADSIHSLRFPQRKIAETVATTRKWDRS